MTFKSQMNMNSSFTQWKNSFSRKWWISSRTALFNIPHTSNCNDSTIGKRELTFPVDLTPFQMQKKHITQTRRRHSARSHLIIPMSSIPEDKLSTLRLNIWKETKQERDAGAQLMQILVVMAENTQWCAGQLMYRQISALKTLAKSVAYMTKAVLCNPTSPPCPLSPMSLWSLQYEIQKHLLSWK